MRTLGTTRPNAYPFRVINKRLIDDLVQAIEGASRTDLIKRATNRGEGWTNSLINVRPVDSSFSSFILDSYLYQRTSDEQGESVDATIETGEVSGVARGSLAGEGVACEFILQGTAHPTPVPSNLTGLIMVVEVVITEIPSSIGADTVSGSLIYEGTTPILGFPVPTLSENTLNGDRALAFGDTWLQLPDSSFVDLAGRKALIWRTGAPSATSSIIEVDVSSLDANGGVGIPVPIALLSEEIQNLSVVVLGIYTSKEEFPVDTVNDTEGTLLSFSSFIAEGTLGSNGMSVASYLKQWTIPSLSEWTGVDRSGLYLGAFISRNDHRDPSDGRIFSAYRPKVTQGGFEGDGDILIGAESNDQKEIFKATGRGLQYGLDVNPFLSSEIFVRELSLVHGHFASLAHQEANLGRDSSSTLPTSLPQFSSGQFIDIAGENAHVGFPFVHPSNFVGTGNSPILPSTSMRYLRHGGFFGFKSSLASMLVQSGPLLSWGFDEALFESFGYDGENHPITGGNFSSSSSFFGAFGEDARISFRVPFNPPHGWDMKSVSFVGAMNWKDGSTPRFDQASFISTKPKLDIYLERHDRTPVQNSLGSSFEVLQYVSYTEGDFLGVNDGGAIHVHPEKSFKHTFEDRVGGGGVWDANGSVSPRYFITIAIRPPAFTDLTFHLSGLQFFGVSNNLAHTDILI